MNNPEDVEDPESECILQVCITRGADGVPIVQVMAVDKELLTQTLTSQLRDFSNKYIEQELNAAAEERNRETKSPACPLCKGAKGKYRVTNDGIEFELCSCQRQDAPAGREAVH